MKEKDSNKNKKNIELQEIIVDKKDPDKDNESKENKNEDKSKQFQIYLYIPLILSSFIYMVFNSVNFLIQIEPDYYIKINAQVESTKLNADKIRMNKNSKNFIIIVLLINMFSKSIGHLITNPKIIKKNIDILLLFSLGFIFGCNIFLFFQKTTARVIYILHIFFSFASGLFFVPLLRINWSFLPFNEGLVTGAFNSFEYFSMIILSLIKRVTELKNLFLVNSILNALVFICIVYLKIKYKGFFTGKLSYLDFSLNQKNSKADPNLVENLIKTEEDESNNKSIKKEGKSKEKGKEKGKEKQKGKDKDEEKVDGYEKIEQFETDKEEEEESNKDDDENSKFFIQNLISDISSNRFILLLVAYILLLFSNYIISLIYLPFSVVFNFKMFLNSSIHLTIYMLVYCISALFFGIYFDLKNVRFIVDRLIFLSLLTIILFFPTKYFSYFLDLLSILNAICLSGIKSVIYPLVYREFFNNERNYYLISIFLFVEIFIYFLAPFILKYFAFELADFIMIFITCFGMLLGGYFIMTKKLFPIIIDTNENYDLNTNRGKGLRQLHLQDELPSLSKE